MTHSIIKHLANLKFYSDFKSKSQAKDFDLYVEYINSGAPDEFDWFSAIGIPATETFEYSDPLEIDQKTEDDIEKFLAKKRQEEDIPKTDLDQWYNIVESEIEYRLNKNNAQIILRKNPFEVLKEFLEKYKDIQEIIPISDDDFYHYTTLMQGKTPEDFFTMFSTKPKKIENYPLIHCYPRIFTNCKSYAFFQSLIKEIEYPSADYSFVFYKMRNEKLIHFYCKDDYEELINKDSKKVIEIYPESKVKNSNFKSTYSRIYQNMY